MRISERIFVAAALFGAALMVASPAFGRDGARAGAGGGAGIAVGEAGQGRGDGPTAVGERPPLPPAEISAPAEAGRPRTRSMVPADVAPAPPLRRAAPAAAIGPLAAPKPPVRFRSMQDAFQVGIRGYNSGDKTVAVEALSYAAEQGYPAARWKLGRMYAAGDGVPADPMRAFRYFQAIADRHAEDGPSSADAPFVANAFVALGQYYLKGIPNTSVKANAVRARQLFSHAASYYGNADAQFSLARLLMDGIGGPADRLQAARWLNLAAVNCHRGAQAVLGHMLFSGGDGVPRQAGRGLALLASARDGASSDGDAGWIEDLHDQAFKVALDRDRQAAAVFAREIRCVR
jgi:hypothetical protein